MPHDTDAEKLPGGLIVTTSLAPTEATVARAREISAELNRPFVARNNLGLGKLFASGVESALIVESSGLALTHRDGTFYRWHPNLGFVRALNILRGQHDLFAEAAQLSTGERVLDCTLGFGSEAMIAALLVGDEGRVVGLESAPELAVVTRSGLQERAMLQAKLQEAMRRIDVIAADYREFLLTVQPGEYDVIYFDPFFEHRIEGSEININPLLRFGNPAPLDVESVLRAIPLATRCVLVKHPRDSELPEPLNQHRDRLVKAKRGPVAYSVFRRRSY